jgi:hypothetical protein
MKMLDKRGQIGEGITWVVATIVILVILIAGIYIASAVAGVKDILGLNKQAEFNGLPDRVAEKSLYSYLLTTHPEGGSVYQKLKTNGELKEEDKFSGDFALKIFNEYKGDYPGAVWFGVDCPAPCARKNFYFGSRPTSVRGGDISKHYINYVDAKIYLDTNKNIELVLMKE